MSIDAPQIEWQVCGNILAAVGPFAVEEGLARAEGQHAQIKVYCPFHGKTLKLDFPVIEGQVQEEGDFSIDGVPGTCAPIGCDYGDASGVWTGKVLPTGRPRDWLDVPAVGSIEVSLVDQAHLMVFVTPQAVGMRGDESPAEIEADRELLRRIEAVRRAATVFLGLEKEFGWDVLENPISPPLAIVQPPLPYKSYATRETIAPDTMDLFAIIVAAGFCHKAYGAGTAACTGVAARIPGSLVYGAMSERGKQDEVVRIGHPSGYMPVRSFVEMVDGQPVVREAKMWRTARRIAQGTVNIPDSVLDRSVHQTLEKVC